MIDSAKTLLLSKIDFGSLQDILGNTQAIISNAIAFLSIACLVIGIGLSVIGIIKWATGWDEKSGKKAFIKGVVLISIALVTGGGMIASYMFI